MWSWRPAPKWRFSFWRTRVPEKLSHVDENGQARMVDVSAKAATKRVAVARGFVRMKSSTVRMIAEGTVAKGDVFATARLAGIMGAKQTSSLIPLTHPLALTSVAVDLEAKEDGIAIVARAECIERTGVEMESMTAVAVAALTIYDMCKAVDREMTIEEICLVRKEGGKSGTYQRVDTPAP